MSKLIISRLDYFRILKCINDAIQLNLTSSLDLKKLLNEINSAEIVNPNDMPSNVVTMNSIVKMTFLTNNKQTKIQIVYPENANYKENKISILSPVATALIGYQVGDVIEWLVPSGVTKMKIDEIIFQPEAAGEFLL